MGTKNVCLRLINKIESNKKNHILALAKSQ